MAVQVSLRTVSPQSTSTSNTIPWRSAKYCHTFCCGFFPVQPTIARVWSLQGRISSPKRKLGVFLGKAAAQIETLPASPLLVLVTVASFPRAALRTKTRANPADLRAHVNKARCPNHPLLQFWHLHAPISLAALPRHSEAAQVRYYHQQSFGSRKNAAQYCILFAGPSDKAGFIHPAAMESSKSPPKLV